VSCSSTANSDAAFKVKYSYIMRYSLVLNVPLHRWFDGESCYLSVKSDYHSWIFQSQILTSKSILVFLRFLSFFQLVFPSNPATVSFTIHRVLGKRDWNQSMPIRLNLDSSLQPYIGPRMCTFLIDTSIQEGTYSSPPEVVAIVWSP